MLKIYNTLSKKIEDFIPIDKSHIKIYVCGPTVYDKIHIGNARPLVVFDTFVRLLRYKYPKVTYVRNITDVDDKINDRLISEKITLKDLTDKTINDFQKDCTSLNNLLFFLSTCRCLRMLYLLHQLFYHQHLLYFLHK